MAEDTPRWREDFPIQWERDHYLTRRELAKFLTLGSGLLAAASGGLVLLGSSPPRSSYPRIRIGSVNAIPASGVLQFRYPTPDDPCLLLRRPDGALAAYSQVCTHLSCAVIYEQNEDQLFCPCHHGVFSGADGRPVAGPPQRPLPRILLDRQEDDLFAVGVEV